MPFDVAEAMDLVSEIVGDEQVKICVGNSVKGGLAVGCVATAGALLFGPVGLAIDSTSNNLKRKAEEGPQEDKIQEVGNKSKLQSLNQRSNCSNFLPLEVVEEDSKPVIVPEQPCSGCEWCKWQFLAMTVDEAKLNSFLYLHKIIKNSMSCPECSHEMIFVEERKTFRCDNKVMKYVRKQKKLVTCHKQVSQNVDTLFENSNLSRDLICRLVAEWAMSRPPRIEFLSNEYDLSPSTVVTWIHLFREICVINVTESTDDLGGPDEVVEMDIAKIGKRNYCRGRVLEGNWVVWALERGTRKVFAVPVFERTSETILDVIKRRTHPGTTVISDCWKDFRQQGESYYQNFAVKYSYKFVDPDCGKNLQSIKRLWREVKSTGPSYGSRKEHSHIDVCEFLFKYKYNNYRQRIHHTFCAIAEIYNGSPYSQQPIKVEDSSEGEFE